MTPTVTFILTFGLTGLTALATLAFDAFGLRRAAVAVAALGTSAAAIVGIAAAVRAVPTSLVGTLQTGGPASMIFGVIALAGAAAIAGGWDDLVAQSWGGSGAALVALGVLAAGAAASAIDLTTVLLAIETSALIAYALVASARSTRSAEASMKYFIQGAVATGLFMFGLAVLVGLFDSTGRYDTLARALAAPREIFPALAGVGLVLCALVFKMGGAPFHSWAPDAYETAPAQAAAFLASGQKLGAIAAASIFVSIAAAGVLSTRILVIVVALAVLSVLIGSLAALRQTDYRRLLGYAGVAQSGYALLAIALFTPPLAAFFGATYALAAAGTFLAASAFKRLRPEWDGSVAGLAGIGRQAPVLGVSVSVLLISLAGLPPFLGFWSKLVVFGTAISVAQSNASTVAPVSWALGAGVALGLLGSVISLAYYGSIMRSMFMDGAPESAAVPEQPAKSAEEGTAPARRTGSAALVVALLALLIAASGIATVVLGSTAIFALFATR